MDLVICSIDLTSREVHFAGAKNSLIYVQNNELIQIKGDNLSIGGRLKTEPYTLHTINAEKGTCFYLFSDGFQDQFGGENNKRFMLKNMKEMFLKHHQQNMQSQQEAYTNILLDWIGGEFQIDDITMIGFRLE